MCNCLFGRREDFLDERALVSLATSYCLETDAAQDHGQLCRVDSHSLLSRTGR